MIPEGAKVLVKDAKEDCWFHTDILKDYMDGQIMKLRFVGTEVAARAVYKVQKGSEVLILKISNCSLDDKSNMFQIKREYELSNHSFKLTTGVAKPLAFKELSNETLKMYYFESIYEYCGNNLYYVFKRATGQEILDIMKAVVDTMAILEDNGIFHSDLKPENIAIKDKVVKLLDFGVSMEFTEKTKLFRTGKIFGGTRLYYPPEILWKGKHLPNKIDVFGWGMTLYELIGERTEEDMENDLNLKQQKATYSLFLENVKNIAIKGDKDNKLKKQVMPILLEVFDINYNRRPTFNELKKRLELMKSFEKEMQAITTETQVRVKEQGKVLYNSR